MKPSSIKKVFGIISYFPDNDSAYHTEMRRERTRRFRELLLKLEEYWPEVDILIIAQNWKDFTLPDTKNHKITYSYGKLGILGARKELRKRFLETDYDYIIMLDDDAMVTAFNPQRYLDEIDQHPDGIGALRWINGPLQLFAISKSKFAQVEYLDVDPEKGQGFEDDLFANRCRTMFPNDCYDFSSDLVKENSLHYNGPGKCPSTYSKEREYDWNYMRSNTKYIINRMEHPIDERVEEESCEHPDIDVIIPYVNGSDQNWVRDFIQATRTHNPTAERFRSWGTLKYLFRGIETYMPFIRQIVLIVARESQIPIWVNQENVRVVLHKDFIPKQFLPTFNSCTIESYLWNIPGLSDRIVYFNDDIFPINRLYVGDFFTEDIPHIGFRPAEEYTSRLMFKMQCRSSMDLVTKGLKLPTYEAGKIIRPHHITTAMTSRGLKAIKDLCEDMIPATISVTRLPKNINQYIYAYYHYFTNDYIDGVVDYKYFAVSDANIESIVNEISVGFTHLVCINDSDNIKNYAKVRDKLIRGFERKFPNKSKYELW